MTAPTQLYSNDGQTTLAAGITSTSLALTVAAGTGALFPNPNVGTQFFLVTLIDEATGGIKEIVRCTARVGDIMTIVRAQEGTDPVAWSAGDLVKMLLTAGTMDNMIQIPQAQAQTFKFAQDTGGINSLVIALSPAVTTRIPGLEVNIVVANSNTGACTLNLGAGSIALVNPDGSALGTGALVAGGVATIIDTGSGAYQLTSSSQQAQSLAGAFTTGGFQWRPTAETLAGWVVANGATIGNAASNAQQHANTDAANLFAWHWNNFSNSQCPVFTSAGVQTSRGANAAADFAASKAIRTIDARGCSLLGMDNMGGLASSFYTGVPISFGNAQTAGSIIGEVFHTLTQAEMPVHYHSAGIFDPTHSHTYSRSEFGQQKPASGGNPPFDNYSTQNTGSSATGVRVNSSNGLDTTYSAGSGGSHNNTDRGMVGTFYIKL
ncbi:hypothetical protein [Bradyrhizobium japonicum]|uniref:hypothetical protein n=1 Tax=Bradyrhizobium japonicum TaxID=375 RepID=UPI0006948C53|nr:hypothetical protein [Bradyrhizobium japonicum]